MATAGDIRRNTTIYHGDDGVTAETWRRNIDLFHDAYTDELAHFMDCVRTGVTPEPTGADACAALAAIESAGSGRPARVATAGRP